jgi:hypothetical protein
VLFSAEAPTLFILFILSHGKEGGVIETDHKNHEGSFETFTTKSVFHALKGNPFLKNTLKLIFFGVSIKFH